MTQSVKHRIYTGDNRASFTVGRVELLYADDTPVLVVYAKRGNMKQHLEEIAISEQKYRANEFYHQLLAQLITYGDKAFWDMWDYTRQHQKWLKAQKASV